MKKAYKLINICTSLEKMCSRDDLISDFMDNISYITSFFLHSLIKEWRDLQQNDILSEIQLHEQFEHFKEGITAEILTNSIKLKELIDKLENIYIKKDRRFIAEVINQIKNELPNEADEIDEDFNKLIKDIGGFNA